jgi:DnaJ-class molecular chaperone
MSKMSKSQHEELVGSINDVKEDLSELEEELEKVTEIVDDCPDCDGFGTIAVPCDPTLGEGVRINQCQKCKGNGYVG